MLGYWNDPEQTAAAIDPAGWMHTGDLATIDEDGHVKVVVRSKGMIRSFAAARTFYPREIEEFLCTHPEIKDVHVVGVPDARYGEEIAAFVIVRTSGTVDTERVREFGRGKIARFKIPRYVMEVDEFPMTATELVQKFKLREL